jgi:hypothetical protein
MMRVFASCEQTCLVALNYPSSRQILTFAGLEGCELIYSSADRDTVGVLHTLELAPFEIYIASVVKSQHGV